MKEEKNKAVAAQLKKPEGEKGKEIGRFMAERNILMNQHVIDAMQLQGGEAVVEIGMGTGAFVKDIVHKGDDIVYIGFDHSELMVEEAIDQNKELVEADKADFYLADAHDLPMKGSAIDKIFTVNTIYFWEKPEKILVEFKRVLKREGLLYLAFRPGEEMRVDPVGQHEFACYDADDIQELLEDNGFEIIETLRKKEPNREIEGVSYKVSTLIIVAKIT